jgi:hypothetical protein
MTEEEFLNARDIMQTALKRAVEIVGYVAGDDCTAQLNIMEDGEAVLTSWRATTDYDCSVLEKEEQAFPSHLLFVSDAEVTAWKAEVTAREEAQSKAWQAQQVRQREAEERALLERLKAKFEKHR